MWGSERKRWSEERFIFTFYFSKLEMRYDDMWVKEGKISKT